MTVIGIAGKAGAGKDTVARILRDNHGFAIISYARPIKMMLCALMNVPLEKWDDREWRNRTLPILNCTPRHLAQTLGTEWGRDCVHESMWRDLAHDLIDTTPDLTKWCISDVRFENEANDIRKRGGTIFHVHRDDIDKATAKIGHASESGIEMCWGDFNVWNEGDIDYLESEIDRLLNTYMEEAA